MEKKTKDSPNLKEGFTTGACSAAAAKAAAYVLVHDEFINEINTTLPIGDKAIFKLKRCEKIEDYAICSVIKNAGDDPDCTDKAELTAKVSLNTTGYVHIYGGVGVAMVTKAGLGLEVGKHAINPVPRKNIRAMILEVIQNSPFSGAEVEISVPGGEEMSKKTINKRLGLLGGISILGTTGIVKPYSTAAFRASVVQSVDLAKNNKVETVVLTTGGRSEQYAMELFPHLTDMSFIQVGDFIGTALKSAKKNHMGLVIIVGMMGKLSKMADGKMMTHAAASEVNVKMLGEMASRLGASSEVFNEILEATTARRVFEICDENEIDGLSDLVCETVSEKCGEHIVSEVPINTYLMDFKGALLTRFEEVKNVISKK